MNWITGGMVPGASETRESCPSPPVGGGGSRSESGSATPTRSGVDDDSMQGVDPASLPINAADPTLSLSVAPVRSPSEVHLAPR